MSNKSENYSRKILKVPVISEQKTPLTVLCVHNLLNKGTKNVLKFQSELAVVQRLEFFEIDFC